MIRAAVIDGHPAMRAGVAAILARTSDIVVVADASGEPHEVAHALYRTTPDVVIIEDAPGRLDGVELARQIKAWAPAPRVVLYADGITPAQIAAATLAGADALLDTRAHERELIGAVRDVVRGQTVFPELDPASRDALTGRLAGDDRDILRMRLASLTPREIARLLKIDARTLRDRVSAMIARLRPVAVPVPAPVPC
jgi:DNA-binding NarL/FixJ family response regulator